MGNRNRQNRAPKALAKNVRAEKLASSGNIARFNLNNTITTAGQNLLDLMRFNTIGCQERIHKDANPADLGQMSPHRRVSFELMQNIDASGIALGYSTFSDKILAESITSFLESNGHNAKRHAHGSYDISIRPEGNVGRTRMFEVKASTLVENRGAEYFRAGFSEGQFKSGRHLVMAFVTDREQYEQTRFLVIPMSKLPLVAAQVKKTKKQHGVRRSSFSSKKNGSGQLWIPADVATGASFDPVLTEHMMDFSAFAEFVRQGLR